MLATTALQSNNAGAKYVATERPLCLPTRVDAPDILRHNALAWDTECDNHGEWSRPVSAEVIANARRGEWQVILTPNKPVPRAWFGDVKGRDVLCLASGGGQQG